jgi:hypothetical protein
VEKRLRLLRDDSVVAGDSDLITSAVIEVLFIVLDNLCGDLVPKVILLTGPLRRSGSGGVRHRGTTPIGDEIRGGRDAGRPPRRLEEAVIASLGCGDGVAVVALRGREARIPSTPPRLRVLGQLETLNSSLALLSNVADDVGNGIRLVLEMTVGNISEARRRHSLTASRGSLEMAVLNGFLLLLLHLIVAILKLLNKVIGLGKRLNEVFKVVALTANQAAQVQDHTASFVTLSKDGDVGVLKLGKLLLIPLALTLKLLSNLLLKNKGLESIITLLLGASKTN